MTILTDLDTHNAAVALTTRMLTLAAEIRAKQAELDAAVIEHFKLTDEPLYLAWCVFPTPDGYEVVTNPRRFAALQQPPKPLVIKPVVVALDVANRETVQQYAESQLELTGEPI